ncbi:MAG: hypothetical protein PVJ42_07870 [bacterium]|jgi:hypothetical protein
MRGRGTLGILGLVALTLWVVLIAPAAGQVPVTVPMEHEIMLIQEDGNAVVVPATQVVRPGDTVKLMAIGDDVTVFFAYKDFFGLDKNTLEVIDGESFTIEIMADQVKSAPADPGPERDAYWKGLGLPRKVHYAAYSMKAHSFAEGHSSPILLIEPPDGEE